MNRLPTNRLERTRLLKRIGASTLRVRVNSIEFRLMEKMNCDNCQENRGDHDPCNFLCRCHRFVHCMIHKSPLQT